MTTPKATKPALLRTIPAPLETPRVATPARWTMRRSLSFILIVSGTIWFAIGLAIRLFLS